MGAKVGGKKGGGMDEINVTPLIDIVLVMLIIFMVLTPMTVEKMASNLPPPDIDEPPPPPDPNNEQLLVAIYADGTLALNLKPETDEELATDVERRLRSKEKKTVFIDAHPDANYQRVVQVMDLVRAKGADRVGLAEMTEAGPAKLPPGVLLPGMQGYVPPAVPPAAPPG